MTPSEERIERLENRIERIEAQVANDIRRIFEKLEALTLSVTKQSCPSPGACVSLGDKLQDSIKAHNATMLRVERLELKLLEIDRSTINEFHKLEKQKMWILGAWSVVAFLAAVIGAIIPVAVNFYLRKP